MNVKRAAYHVPTDVQILEEVLFAHVQLATSYSMLEFVEVASWQTFALTFNCLAVKTN